VVSPCSDRVSRAPPYSRTLKVSTRTGLSPTTAKLSSLFHFNFQCHWPGPRSLATTCGVSVDVLSCRYLDVSVPCVRFLHPMYSGVDTLLQYLETILVSDTPDDRRRALRLRCCAPRMSLANFHKELPRSFASQGQRPSAIVRRNV
jgi:hypothetical protein